MNNKAQAGGIAAIVGVLVLFGSLMYFFAAFDTVDANHVGVKNKIGKITGTMNPGLEHTGVFTKVFQYNLMTRPVLIDMTGAASSAPTAEGQPIFATINLNWRIKKDAVIGLYENIGTNEQIYSNLNIEAKVMQGFKSVTTQYKDALMIQNNRQEVVDKAVEAIIAQLPTEYIIIDSVVISKLSYDQAYQNAINLRKTNEMLAYAEEEAVKIAEHKATQVVKQAEGAKQVKILEAEAKAQEFSIQSREITEQLLEKQRIEAWAAGGAQVPKFLIMGDTGAGTNMLMQLPMAELMS